MLLFEPWFGLSLIAVFSYGISDGVYKQFLDESISVSRFCAYGAITTILFYGGFAWYWHLTEDHPMPFALHDLEFMLYGTLSSTLETTAWILTFEAIVHGPVSIVGPISAAYPAVTAVIVILDARYIHLLDEILFPWQYVGVAVVILGCMGIAYEPSSPTEKPSRKILGIPIWFYQSALAAILWGIGGFMDRWVYELPNASEANFLIYGGIGDVIYLGGYGLIRARVKKEWDFSFKEFGWACVPLMINGVADVALTVA
ncbi:MAG: EamA family transporter, partial [Acidobacteriota bacterium]